MTETREKLFDDLKDLILTLKGHRNEPLSDVNLIKRWQDKQHRVLIGIGKLNAEDRQWMEKEYRTWYQKELAPLVKELEEKGVIVLTP